MTTPATDALRISLVELTAIELRRLARDFVDLANASAKLVEQGQGDPGIHRRLGQFHLAVGALLGEETARRVRLLRDLAYTGPGAFLGPAGD